MSVELSEEIRNAIASSPDLLLLEGDFGIKANSVINRVEAALPAGHKGHGFDVFRRILLGYLTGLEQCTRKDFERLIEQAGEILDAKARYGDPCVCCQREAATRCLTCGHRAIRLASVAGAILGSLGGFVLGWLCHR